jgi:GH35 family endo-1,4-beta-xylanase
MRALRWIAAALALVLACARAPVAPPAGAPGPAPASASEAPVAVNPLPSRQRAQAPDGFFLQPAGLADHYSGESAPEKMKRNLAEARAVGVQHLRFAVGWDSTEVEPGKYDWSEWDALFGLLREAGVTPLPYICCTPRWLSDPKEDRRRPADPRRFARFVSALIQRYRGQAPSWELWNEPDDERYWPGTAEEFAQLVEAGARAVRAADPGARVVLGGMSKWRSPFLEDLLGRYQVGRSVDVISLHGYLETWDPGRAEEYPARIEAVARLVSETAPQADLWLAGFGYSDFRLPDGRPSEQSYAVHSYEHTERFQAVALFRAHVLALASQRLSLTTWYRIDDLPPAEGAKGDENDKHLGIVDVQGRPKPAFHALRLYQQLLARPVRLADARAQVHASGGSIVHLFEAKSGEVVVVAWLRSALSAGDPGGRADDPREDTIAVRLPVDAGELTEFDVTTGEPVRTEAVLDGPLLAGIQLRGDSIFVARIAPKPAPAPRRPR